MADKSFTLIGNFTDNITPSLDKITRSLEGVKKSLDSVSKVTAPLKRDFKDLADHSKDFKDSLKGQAGELTAITSALRAYRAEIVRLKRSQRGLKLPTSLPGGGGGGGGYGGGNGRYRPASGPVARDATYVFGQVLGNQLAGMITGAVVQGFQMGVGLMTQPFQYLASAMRERIADEQSDIKAAGGYFSIARRQDKPFLKTFAEAMRYTQENNKHMADLAAALPGNTQQYIEVNKRLSDTITRTVMRDTKGAIELANRLRADPNRIGGIAAPITDLGARGQKQAIIEIGGELTKSTVLAGLGGGAQGGVAGAYGLPGLTERLVSQETVSMGQFRRYAAIFRDPMIMDALERFIPEINKFGKETPERLNIIMKMFKEILPDEQIRAFMRSTAGILEMYRTAFLGPETGFLGLGRKLQGMGKAMDDMGRFVDAQDRVVKDISQAANVSLSLYDMLRDIFANFNLALYPIIEYLPQLFDPLRAIGLSLVDLRHYSGRFLSNFESYKQGLIKYAESLKDSASKEKILGSLDIRATLATINNAFRGAGIYGFGSQSMATFRKYAEQIESTALNPGVILKEFIKIFLESNASKEFGRRIGNVIKVVLQQVSNMLDQLVGLTEASGLIKGLKEGFGEEGKKAFANIIRRVFEGIGKILLEVFRAIPFEILLIGILTTAVPSVTAAMSTVIGNRIERVLDSPGIVKRLGSPKDMLGGLKTFATKGPKGAVPRGGGGSFWGRFPGYATSIPKSFMAGLKAISPKLLAFGGVLSAIIALLEGKSILEAISTGLGSAGGAAIGAAIGTVIFPGIGTVVGSVLGSLIGSLKPVTDFISGVIMGVGWGLFELMGSLGPLMDSLIGILSASLGGIAGLIPGVDHLTRNFDLLNFTFILIKVALFPFIAAINGVSFALGLVRLGMLKFDQWVNKTFQWGDRQGRLQAEIDKAGRDLEAIAARQAKLNQSLLQPVSQGGSSLSGPRVSPSSSAGAPPELAKPAVETARAAQETSRNTKTQTPQIAQTQRNTATANTTLGNIRAGIMSVSSKLSGIQAALLGDLNNIQAGVGKISSLLHSGNLRVKGAGGMGGPMGTGKGNLGAAQRMAERHGLSLTSFLRMGDKGFHGLGRAMDFSNGVNTPQQMAFAKEMIARFGESITELIYTPLGFGIKNGKAVPLSYWGEATNAAHWNHVHVAFALGPRNPAFFSNQRDAIAWERSMVPGSARVASVTTNSNEMLGGYVNAPITIYQQPGQDAEELATIVVTRLSMAVQSMSNNV